jgi:SAC3/GANP family
MQERESDWIQVMLATVHAIRSRDFYAFFNILDLAPYLYGCLMFSYVKKMRQQVLTVMAAATYGEPRWALTLRVQPGDGHGYSCLEKVSPAWV